MKYYFYIVSYDEYKNPSNMLIDNVLANKSDWIELSSAQTEKASLFLSSGSNYGRDNIIKDDIPYIIYSSWMDISDPSNMYVLYICTPHPEYMNKKSLENL